ncbi:hypothetical protein CR162_21190 [Pseudoroseomonas rhizosphaerae]|uniref:Uncharacterized protein n=1 Tax=Teichococcus rhizosphaerae TaxID=1335062 RepID=A0A2C7A4Q6_9PROT|nr:hypothetical protein [Pseudoroseomonas rhizosphaerae]PHK92949.1 hypothetical protein CR162_21190 [Pseudoroseomonas rhizosphaerae]
MAFDIRRGLLRAWVLLSFLWVLYVGVLGFREVKEEWAPGIEQAAIIDGDNMAAVPCEAAPTGHTKIEGFGRTYCLLPVLEFRRQNIEYRDLDYNEVIRRSYQRVGLHFGWRYDSTKMLAAFALIPPILLLALGAAVVWVIRGFRRA